MRLTRLFAALCLLVIPAACTTVDTASPGTIANQTVLDEKTGIAIETAYTAAATAGTLAIRGGLVSSAQALKIADIDRRAYTLVLATRAAYDAGNAKSYQDAAAQAIPLLRELVAAIKGEVR